MSEIRAEVALEVIRDSWLRYKNADKERKTTSLRTLEEDIEKYASVENVLVTAVVRYKTLVDVQIWLKSLCAHKLSTPRFFARLEDAPKILRDVNTALRVSLHRDIPAEIAKAVKAAIGTTEQKEG